MDLFIFTLEDKGTTDTKTGEEIYGMSGLAYVPTSNLIWHRRFFDVGEWKAVIPLGSEATLAVVSRVNESIVAGVMDLFAVPRGSEGVEGTEWGIVQAIEIDEDKSQATVSGFFLEKLLDYVGLGKDIDASWYMGPTVGITNVPSTQSFCDAINYTIGSKRRVAKNTSAADATPQAIASYYQTNSFYSNYAIPLYDFPWGQKTFVADVPSTITSKADYSFSRDDGYGGSLRGVLEDKEQQVRVLPHYFGDCAFELSLVDAVDSDDVFTDRLGNLSKGTYSADASAIALKIIGGYSETWDVLYEDTTRSCLFDDSVAAPSTAKPVTFAYTDSGVSVSSSDVNITSGDAATVHFRNRLRSYDHQVSQNLSGTITVRQGQAKRDLLGHRVTVEIYGQEFKALVVEEETVWKDGGETTTYTFGKKRLTNLQRALRP